MMTILAYIAAIAAILAGGGIFLFSRTLHNFQKFVGFTFIFEGLTILLGASVMAPGAPIFLPKYLLYIAMMLAAPFFYYFAVKYLLKEDGVHGRDYWMLILVAVFIATFAVAMCSLSPAERLSDLGLKVMASLDAFAYMLLLFENIFILIFCLININRYRDILANYYSNPDTFRSAKIIVIAVALRFAVMSTALFQSASAQNLWLLIAQSAISVAFYAIAAIFVCRVNNTAEELSIMVRTRDQKANPKTPAADEIIASRLGKLIEDKFYLNPDVNLMDISADIQVNSKYVSDYLRFHYDETFLVFVNRLRIEHSQQLLKSSSSSIEDIAEESGYTSVSTFYRNFIKIRGVNPSEYRENARSSCK